MMKQAELVQLDSALYNWLVAEAAAWDAEMARGSHTDETYLLLGKASEAREAWHLQGRPLLSRGEAAPSPSLERRVEVLEQRVHSASRPLPTSDTVFGPGPDGGYMNHIHGKGRKP
jgi:hypothetical protein